MCAPRCAARVGWFILTRDLSPTSHSPGQPGRESCCRLSASSISEGIQLTGLLLVSLGGCPRQGTQGEQAGAGGAPRCGTAIVATSVLPSTCTLGAWESWMGWRTPCSCWDGLCAASQGAMETGRR